MNVRNKVTVNKMPMNNECGSKADDVVVKLFL